MVWILPKLSNYQQVAPSARTGGSRHTGLAAPPHRNIHAQNKLSGTKGLRVCVVPWFILRKAFLQKTQ